MAQWKRLASESDYQPAVDRVNMILDVIRTDEIQNEIMLLSYLIEEYDAVHYPMPDAAPGEVLKFALEMRGLKQMDLSPFLGSKGNVSKILKGNGKLQLDQVRALSTFLKIPLESLIPQEVPRKNISAKSSMISKSIQRRIELSSAEVSEPITLRRRAAAKRA